jgi:cation/acetate symporter
MFWRRCTTLGIVTAMLTGTGATLLLIYLSPTVQVDILHRETAWFPLKNPALVTLPLGFLSGILVSLLAPEAAAAEAYVAAERRGSLGQAEH